MDKRKKRLVASLSAVVVALLASYGWTPATQGPCDPGLPYIDWTKEIDVETWEYAHGGGTDPGPEWDLVGIVVAEYDVSLNHSGVESGVTGEHHPLCDL